jgi:hypothetical protein
MLSTPRICVRQDTDMTRPAGPLNLLQGTPSRCSWAGSSLSLQEPWPVSPHSSTEVNQDTDASLTIGQWLAPGNGSDAGKRGTR